MASILRDPISAFALAMLLWTALIAYTLYMASRERRGELKPKTGPEQDRDHSELD